VIPHFTAKNSKKFVDINTGAHTQKIEIFGFNLKILKKRILKRSSLYARIYAKNFMKPIFLDVLQILIIIFYKQ
jgi:hypothetical protein